jgi:hypothetical protein
MKNMKGRQRYGKISCSILLVFCVSVFNTGVKMSWAADAPAVKNDQAANSVADPAPTKPSEETEKKDTEGNASNTPQQTKTSTSSTLLYGGLGVAAVAAVVAAAASGGGSDSGSDATDTTTTTTPTTDKKTIEKSTTKIKRPSDKNPPNTDPVGPDLRGSDWHGYLDIVHGSKESVSATVKQNGNYIVITTSSNQSYGKKFIGNTTASGRIEAYDQNSGEIWSTEKGNASENRIDLYDYVDNYKNLDHLALER